MVWDTAYTLAIVRLLINTCRALAVLAKSTEARFKAYEEVALKQSDGYGFSELKALQSRFGSLKGTLRASSTKENTMEGKESKKVLLRAASQVFFLPNRALSKQYRRLEKWPSKTWKLYTAATEPAGGSVEGPKTEVR